MVAVVTSGNFTNGAPGAACVHFQGSNVTITNNQFVWDGIGIDNTYYGNDTNTVISNNYFTEQGWALGCAGAVVTNTNYQFYGNWLHNFDGWTQTGAHVNGIHCYDNSGGPGIQSFYLYNNRFDGNMGTGGWTAWVYMEDGGSGKNWNNNTGTLWAFNNIFGTIASEWGMPLYRPGVGSTPLLPTILSTGIWPGQIPRCRASV